MLQGGFDPDPGRHSIGTLDPDPHLDLGLDQDPNLHETNPDPKHWLEEFKTNIYINI
jgi:hypothetical protein